MHSDKRLNTLQNWLNHQLKLEFSAISPASSDASLRRYFRINLNNTSYIVMDAPPELESLQEFIDIDSALISLGLHAPVIYEKNIKDGFLLLEDLGTRMYLDELNDQTADELYSKAIDAMIIVQKGIISLPNVAIPPYTAEFLLSEMQLFEEWYLEKHLQKILSAKQAADLHHIYKLLVDSAISQPQTWVHRDYHSRNLMICDNNNPGIIDFQGMLTGAISYDLASLFKDCYIKWPRDRVEGWLEQYYEKASQQLPFINFDLQQLIKYFDFIGLQRHLKVLGLFSRLNYRDNKKQYLDDIPLVLQYILETCELYDELEPLADILNSMNSSS